MKRTLEHREAGMAHLPARTSRLPYYFSTALRRAFVALAVLIPAGSSARGELAEFELIPAMSTLRLAPGVFNSSGAVISGTRLLNSVGVVALEQNPQSVIAQLAGTLVGELSGGTLTLDSRSSVRALENPTGPFVPASSETGSFAVVDVFGALAVSSNDGQVFDQEGIIAVRDLEVNLVSGTLTIGGPANSIVIEVDTGIVDISQNGVEPFFETLPDLLDPAGNTSSQPVTGNFDETIQIPFTLNYSYDVVIFPFGTFPDAGRISLAGTLVAARTGMPPVPGDFDGNRVVNAADLTQWKGDYNLNGESNADGDADSDGADFLIWQRQLGVGTAGPSTAVVPEPAASWLAVAAAASLARWPRFRHSHWRLRASAKNAGSSPTTPLNDDDASIVVDNPAPSML